MELVDGSWIGRRAAAKAVRRVAHRLHILPGATAVLGLALAFGAGPPAPAQERSGRRDCTSPEADCTLAEAARQSGIFAGAAVANGIPAKEAAGVLAHFNAVTTENAFKWSSLSRAEGVYDFRYTDELVRFALRNGLRLRGHTLFWHRSQLPQYVRDAVESADDPAARLRAIMRRHVRAVVGRYRGRVPVYDVVNEPLSLLEPGFDTADSALSPANVFFNALGVEYIAEAFRLVHEVDPNAKLFLNEFIWDPRHGDPKADFFLDLVRDLVASGVPIHGVGLQTHGVLGVTSPVFPETAGSFREYMDAFADLGLVVEITELDVALPLLAGAPDPLQAQADVYRRVATACATAASCTGVTVWGVHDGETWLDDFPLTAPFAPNRPLLLDPSLRPKPAYFAVRDALLTRCDTAEARPGSASALPDTASGIGRPCSRAFPRPFPPPR